MLLESEFSCEFTVTFGALMQTLAPGVFARPMVCQVASFLEGHRAIGTGERTLSCFRYCRRRELLNESTMLSHRRICFQNVIIYRKRQIILSEVNLSWSLESTAASCRLVKGTAAAGRVG